MYELFTQYLQQLLSERRELLADSLSDFYFYFPSSFNLFASRARGLTRQVTEREAIPFVRSRSGNRNYRRLES